MITFKRKNDQDMTAVVLDTSGIIDGRVLEIARAGFIPQNVIVAQFVIAELQFLADHGDSHKRERARYGLDVIRELQDVRKIEVSIAREKFNSIKEVDDKLVALAKQYGAFLYTTDFNLNKVAQIEGVQVLNVNELAHALRPNLLPGERVTIKLTQIGQDKTQGVGYLNDGTMVVVEQASRYIGQQVQAVCTRILQTQAGKMMFATLASKPSAQQDVRPVSVSEPAASVGHGAGPEHTRPDQPKSKNRGDQQGAQRQLARADRLQVTQQKPKRTPQHADNVQEPVRQDQSNSPRAGSVYHAQPQRAPKPQGTQHQTRPRQQPSSRPSHGQPRRRFSPEDSLLATIKEMDKN